MLMKTFGLRHQVSGREACALLTDVADAREKMTMFANGLAIVEIG